MLVTSSRQNSSKQRMLRSKKTPHVWIPFFWQQVRCLVRFFQRSTAEAGLISPSVQSPDVLTSRLFLPSSSRYRMQIHPLTQARLFSSSDGDPVAFVSEPAPSSAPRRASMIPTPPRARVSRRGAQRQALCSKLASYLEFCATLIGFLALLLTGGKTIFAPPR